MKAFEIKIIVDRNFNSVPPPLIFGNYAQSEITGKWLHEINDTNFELKKQLNISTDPEHISSDIDTTFILKCVAIGVVSVTVLWGIKYIMEKHQEKRNKNAK